MIRLIGLIVGVATLTATASVASAEGAPYCEPGETPAFHFGFATLGQMSDAPMGVALECEHANPANGDTLQKTSTGLAFYRKSTNTPTFTDGFNHWALTSAGVLTWVGANIDPPVAVTTPPPSAAPQPPTPANPARPAVVDVPAFTSIAQCELWLKLNGYLLGSYDAELRALADCLSDPRLGGLP